MSPTTMTRLSELSVPRRLAAAVTLWTRDAYLLENPALKVYGRGCTDWSRAVLMIPVQIQNTRWTIGTNYVI